MSKSGTFRSSRSLWIIITAKPTKLSLSLLSYSKYIIARVRKTTLPDPPWRDHLRQQKQDDGLWGGSISVCMTETFANTEVWWMQHCFAQYFSAHEHIGKFKMGWQWTTNKRVPTVNYRRGFIFIHCLCYLGHMNAVVLGKSSSRFTRAPLSELGPELCSLTSKNLCATKRQLCGHEWTLVYLCTKNLHIVVWG